MQKILFLLVAILFLFSSCLVLHRGEVSGNALLNTNVSYVDIARGNSKSIFVFGLGNLKNEGLVVKAKYDMYRNRPLKENEFYANFTTSITDKYIFLFAHVTRVNISADVLKTESESTEPSFTEGFKKIIWNVPNEINLQNKTAVRMDNFQILNIGDSVYYAADKKHSEYNLYTISSLSKEKILLQAISTDYKNIIATPKKSRNILIPSNTLLFLKNPRVGEFKHGEKVSVEVFDTLSAQFIRITGTILGGSNDQALVKTKNGISVTQLSQLKKAP